MDYANLPVLQREANGKDGGGRTRGDQHRQRHTEATAGETEQNDVYMQEHLTKYSRNLLKEAKETFSAMGFEYAGYIKDGEVRVKKTSADKPHTIRSKMDIQRLKDDSS